MRFEPSFELELGSTIVGQASSVKAKLRSAMESTKEDYQ